MTNSQTAAAVGTIVLTGEAVATWISEHSEFLIAAAIVGFFVMVSRSVFNANQKRP